MALEQDKPVILLGGGGHGSVVLDALLACEREVLGFVDRDPNKRELLGINRLGDEEALSACDPEAVLLASGLGSVGRPDARLEKFVVLKERGFRFATVVHPSAVVAREVELGEGVQVMTGAVLQPGVRIGENTIVNTNASVDHDCIIGAHVHIAPGATLSGGVYVGRESHIGAGAVVIQGIRIGERCLVGAGAVVVRSVPDGSTVVGVPARSR